MTKDLSALLVKELSAYSKKVDEGVKELTKETAEEAVKELKDTSPKRTGKYARGWKAKKTENGYIVHNSKQYMKTHLLEKGHAKIGGGRVPAYVHIAPVEQQVIEKMTKGVEKLKC